MSQLARVLSTCLASGLVVGAGGFVTMNQAQQEDIVSRSAASPDAVFASVGYTRSENDLDSFLQRLDQPSRQAQELRVKKHRLSAGLKRPDEVPVTGVAYPGLGEVDLCMPLMWSDSALLFGRPYSQSGFIGARSGITKTHT